MEGDRMKYVAFRNALDYALEKSIQSFSLNDFLKCFTFVTKTDKDILKNYHNKACKILRESLKVEFDIICKERNVAELIPQMDALIQKQPILNSGERCPLPLDVSPVDICRANKEEREAIKKEIQNPEAELAQVYAETDQLQDTYDAVLADVLRLLDSSKVPSMCSLLSNSIPADSL